MQKNTLTPHFSSLPGSQIRELAKAWLEVLERPASQISHSSVTSSFFLHPLKKHLPSFFTLRLFARGEMCTFWKAECPVLAALTSFSFLFL